MSWGLLPFHCDEISNYIPKMFTDNPSLFTSAPKFTTFRANRLKFSPEEIVEKIKINLNEDALKLGHETIPEVYVHNVIKDCLVIGVWKGNNEENDFKIKGNVTIDVPCGNAVLRGADIFAPGVLALSTNVTEGDIVNIYVDIKGTCRRGAIKIMYDDKLLIGYGIVKIKRRTIFENNAVIKGVAIDVIYRKSQVPSINLDAVYGILQNFPSIVCSHVLSPSCNSHVLDMCASPGNKTTHIACLMKNQGKVIALDKTSKKVDKIKNLCETLGLTNVSAYVWDSTKAVTKDAELHSDGTPPFCKDSFDRILLDAPCSALGQRPNLYNKISVKQLQSYIQLQKQLFHNAVELLKPGSTLVYSTCTITIDENEGIIKWALEKFKNLKLVKAEPYFGSPGLIESGLSNEERGYIQRFNMTPADSPENDTVGFFIAKFVKSFT